MSAAAFLGVALVHLLAAISPGPAFVMAVRIAVGEGFRAAAGLSLLFDLVPPLYVAIKLAGGLFLLWLAVTMWRHAREPVAQAGTIAPRGTAASIRLGFATQIANPKAAIFFGAVFVGLVPATAGWADRSIVLFNTFWVETACYLVVARVFSAPRARAAYARLKTATDRCLGTALGALGLKVALS